MRKLGQGSALNVAVWGALQVSGRVGPDAAFRRSATHAGSTGQLADPAAMAASATTPAPMAARRMLIRLRGFDAIAPSARL